MPNAAPTLAEWLVAQLRAPPPYQAFETTDVVELTTCDERMEDHLAALVRRSALDPALLGELVQLAGWELGEAAVAQRVPSEERATRGRFGEVLTVAMLQEFDGYVVPVEKAQYTVTGGQSQPSTDTLALRVGADGEIVEVCFVESKLRTTVDASAPMQGVRQLDADYGEITPDMILFTAARLCERGDPLYEPFMRYLASRDEQLRDSFRLNTVYETANFSEMALQNIEDDEPRVKPLHVTITKIEGLRDLVTRVFTRVGVIADTDE